jgi:hypothetical protein
MVTTTTTTYSAKGHLRRKVSGEYRTKTGGKNERERRIYQYTVERVRIEKPLAQRNICEKLKYLQLTKWDNKFKTKFVNPNCRFVSPEPEKHVTNDFLASRYSPIEWIIFSLKKKKLSKDFIVHAVSLTPNAQ